MPKLMWIVHIAKRTQRRRIRVSRTQYLCNRMQSRMPVHSVCILSFQFQHGHGPYRRRTLSLHCQLVTHATQLTIIFFIFITHCRTGPRPTVESNTSRPGSPVLSRTALCNNITTPRIQTLKTSEHGVLFVSWFVHEVHP